jgi:DNA-binding winged helix-turn-helix (wHTH) protein/Tfp pilus assembly protein PilF
MTFTFGPFEADRAAYGVTRGRTRLDLTPKLLDLLFYFLDRPGRLITKEELLDGVWPGANVTDNAMAQAISDLREALDDDAGSPTFIRTIARRGYRFIADVTPGTPASKPPASSTPAAAVAPITTAPATDSDRTTLAVLDFVNLSKDPEVAWLGAGIAETVSSDLGSLDRFRVIDRWRVVEAVQRTDGSLREIGAAVGAMIAVTGSFQRSGPHLRITARMVDLKGGDILADAKVDGALSDVFSLQDGIVLAFSREIGLPAGSGGPRIGVRETSSLEAFRAYIEGWLKLESLDLGQNAAAIRDFERAIAVDPRYAIAYTGLANAEFVNFEMTRATRTPHFAALDKGIEHARHAVHLDRELSEAHATLSFLLTSAFQFDEARRAARQAVALKPDNWRHQYRLGHALWGEARLRAFERMLALHPQFAYARFEMAMVHVARGQADAAMALVHEGAGEQDRQARTVDRFPAVGFHWLLGAIRGARGDYAGAIPCFDREVEQADSHRLYRAEYAAAALIWRGHASMHLGQPADAADAFAKALTYIDDHPRALLGLAAARARTDGTDNTALVTEARAFIDGLRQPNRTAEWLWGSACLAAAEGDAPRAVAMLGDLLNNHPASYVGWTIPIEPAFLSLRGQPGFAGLLDRLADRAK